MSEFTAIGIDVGGTKIAGGVVTFPEGTVHARETVPTPSGSNAIAEEIESLATLLQERSPGLEIRGVGLGLCEIVSAEGASASHCFPTWGGDPLRERLLRLGPVRIEADVRAAARAEALLGAGRALRCFLYVSIGTGISSCLVIDGEPFLGANGATGTMATGPLPSFWGDASDAIGPSLEEIASGPALVARFTAAGGKARNARDVLSAAELGNSEAIRIVKSGAAALGGAIGWLINVLDPECVILGGGLGLSEGLFREGLIRSARAHIWRAPGGDMGSMKSRGSSRELAPPGGGREFPIVSAATGADAGWIGAAAALWKEKSAAH